MDALDPAICRKARLSRDPRFDGEFFLAVSTTGIYCRPVCPARPPLERNVSYFRTAAAAAQEGYRPCLRCRPESAPQSPAWLGTATTVKRALDLIQEGYLNYNSLSQLSARLGVGERYLRKLFEQQLGATPSSVAQTQRLHFAQKLLHETALPITEIAFASGFGSIRRFNSATAEAFGCSPRELRRKQARASGKGIVLEMSYRQPYDWDGVLDFFGRHALDGVESVEEGCYTRNLLTDYGPARIRVDHHPRKPCLRLHIVSEDNAVLMPLVTLVRRMFDLDAHAAAIESELGHDEHLRRCIEAWPGVRSPVVASRFECALRAILGQQISIGAARKLLARITAACANSAKLDGSHVLLFPKPEQVAALKDDQLPMPGRRRETLRAVCRYFAEGAADDPEELLSGLASLRGIGPWTLSIVAMRGLGQPDAFPHTDLGLMKSFPDLEALSPAQFRERTNQWKPWRSYAANLLWRNLCHE